MTSVNIGAYRKRDTVIAADAATTRLRETGIDVLLRIDCEAYVSVLLTREQAESIVAKLQAACRELDEKAPAVGTGAGRAG